MQTGPLIIDLNGTTLTDEDRQLLQHPLVGGIILFARNYEHPAQIQRLIRAIKTIRPSLLIAVDQEGGKVQRFQEGFTRLPAVQEIGNLYADSPKEAIRTAEHWGYTMAHELREVGVDLSFAPVLDVNHEVSSVIGSRSFHRDPLVVSQLAEAYIKGMKRAGMAATGKHFPGHGAVVADSHFELPRDERTLIEIEQTDLVPFKQLISKLNAIMAVHVIYSAVDQQPAGFSSVWLQTILREKLGFQGIIFSDCLNMAAAAIAGDHLSRVETALSAGCDMVLICNNRSAVEQVLGKLHWRSSPLFEKRFFCLLPQ